VTPAPAFWAAFALLLAGCGQEPDEPGSSAGSTAAAWNAPAPDFTLTDQRGRPFRLSDERGRPVMLFFGYAHCPDVCPTALSTWTRVEERLGERAAEVTFALVTVDPERDTAERMARHLAVFSPRFRGLRGTEEELEPVWAAYGIAHEKIPLPGGGGGYVVDHSSSMFLIGPDGRLERTFDFRTQPGSIALALKDLFTQEQETE